MNREEMLQNEILKKRPYLIKREKYMDPIEQEKQSAWEAENDEVKTLLNDGADKYFKQEFPDLKHSFLSKLECVVCMDEGTAHKDYGGESKFCMAGSGILFPANSEEERIQKVAKMFIDLGISEVTSHGGCGAAGLAYKRDFPDAKSTTPEQIEEYAKNWARKVAEEMGRLGHEENFGHIATEEMERPAEFHVARVVYYDCIGGFNPNKEIGLPMGFVIERKHEPAEYAQEELKVAADIAFGHHGFGDRFSKDLPFVIIVLAASQDEVQNIKKQIEETLKENKNLKEGKIKIDGAVV